MSVRRTVSADFCISPAKEEYHGYVSVSRKAGARPWDSYITIELDWESSPTAKGRRDGTIRLDTVRASELAEILIAHVRACEQERDKMLFPPNG